VRNGVERHAGTTSYGDDEVHLGRRAARTDGSTLTWIQQQIDISENNDPCAPTAPATRAACRPAGTLGSLTDPMAARI